MVSEEFPPALYVAATPIGHLSDITERVRRALAQCDVICSEDTRRAAALLSALGITRPRQTIHAVHQHNEAESAAHVADTIRSGKSVLLITDAGTPAISDPGHRVVDAVWAAGLRVSPLPGPSALTAAVSISGFARWPVSFWGFPPNKTSVRQQWLGNIREAGGLAVLYEAPHRAGESLADCAEIFGAQTPMLFAREMTKQFETVFRGSIREVMKHIADHLHEDPSSAKGEMVWVFDLGNADDRPGPREERLSEWAQALSGELPDSHAARLLVKMLKVSRDDAYGAMLAAKKKSASD